MRCADWFTTAQCAVRRVTARSYVLAQKYSEWWGRQNTFQTQFIKTPNPRGHEMVSTGRTHSHWITDTLSPTKWRRLVNSPWFIDWPTDGPFDVQSTRSHLIQPGIHLRENGAGHIWQLITVWPKALNWSPLISRCVISCPLTDVESVGAHGAGLTMGAWTILPCSMKWKLEWIKYWVNTQWS